MSASHNLNIIKTTVKLLKEYDAQSVLCSTEFVESKKTCDVPNEALETYVRITKHQGFFDDLLEIIWTQYQLKRINKWTTQILIYLVVFVLREENFDGMKALFKSIRYKFTMKVIEFFLYEENQIATVRTCAKYFDNDYVLKHVIQPLLEKSTTLKKMHEELCYELNVEATVFPKEVTIPIAPNCLRASKSPTAPLNSPKETPGFKASKVPISKYKSRDKVERNLIKIKEENFSKAMKLLKYSNDNSFNCANVKPKKKVEEEKPQVIKPAKAPNFKKNVEVKKTTATLMREAALLSKDRENELKKLEEMLSGAFDQSRIAALEDDIRKTNEEDYLQDIERKHLQGLVTFEEAVLAKKKLLETNQEKMEEFKAERVKITEEIFEWKEKEREKIKVLVEKSQSIEKSAKEAGKRLLEEKQSRAKLIDHESKMLLQEAYVQRERDLAEKVKLIHKLRALHQVRSLNTKEFDPTECPNFGFLCEMSIAELRERLVLVTAEMREELEERRKAIGEERRRKEALVESVKEFISQSRMSKPKPVPSSPPKFEQAPDIVALRERLQHVRDMRMKAVKCLK